MATPQLDRKMQADYLIKYPKNHPSMTPRLTGIRLTGGVLPHLFNSFLPLRSLTGQMPSLLQAKSSISGFNIREGAEIKIIVTVRNKPSLNRLSDYINFLLLKFSHKAVSHSRGPLTPLSAFPELDLPSPGANIHFGLDMRSLDGHSTDVAPGLNVSILRTQRSPAPGAG